MFVQYGLAHALILQTSVVYWNLIYAKHWMFTNKYSRNVTALEESLISLVD